VDEKRKEERLGLGKGEVIGIRFKEDFMMKRI
jgi:hypothetical protein